jgi:15-cis-phytoene synthase
MAEEAGAYLAGLVRTGDPNRYFATLLAPAQHRTALLALFAFNLEVARVRETVSGALPGEIRLQWWRDALEGERRAEARANPVFAALDDAIERYWLPRPALTALIDARMFDLYDDPMPDVATLEGYAGETSSSLIRLGSLVLADGADPGAADAAGHTGVAVAIAGLLRAFPFHARRGQLYLPADLLQRHGVTREDIVTGRGGPGLVSALAEARALARDHLAKARAAAADIPRAIVPAFLPAALVEPYLGQMERAGYDPYLSLIDIPAWRKIARLWWAMRRGRF